MKAKTLIPLAILISIFVGACSTNQMEEPQIEDNNYILNETSLPDQDKTEEPSPLIVENSALVKELKMCGADVQATKRGVVINLPDAFFEFDRYTLTPDAVRALKEISSVLKRTTERVISIEGHTDYIGRVKYNKDLSLKRASSVMTELKLQGVNSKEMTVKGFGEGYPIATNNSEAGRNRNRRVEIIISN